MDQLIITRFNYRFKQTDPTESLFKKEYWQRRLGLFETFCFASVCAQTETEFDWIIIIDQLLPDDYREQLEKLINKHYQSINYHKQGPRKIWLHPWSYSDYLYQTEWIAKIRPLKAPLLVTTRLDSDDALSNDFVATLRRLAEKTKIKGFLIVSFAQGFTWNQNKLGEHLFKTTRQPLIALGLSLIAERTKFPLTVYCGRHTRLLTYLKKPHEHAIFKPFYQANNELNLSRPAQLALARQRYLIIRTGHPVYIRTIHDDNLQSNLRKANKASNQTQLIKQRFTLAIDTYG